MFRISSFLPFAVLKFWLMPMFGMFFAAGGDALGALGGDSSAVVLDTGGDEGGGEGEGTSDGTGSGEGEGTREGEGEGEAAGKPKEQAGPELAKPLSTAAKTFMKEAKAANPAAWKEISQRLWALNGIDQKVTEHFENGIDGAIELKTNVDTFLSEAGAQDLQEVRTELNDFRLTDGKIIKGDPTFINDLPENVQTGLYKMMPSFVGEWAGKDKASYDRYFAGVVVNTLRDTDFTYNMQTAVRELERMGLDNADVKTVHDIIKGNLDWINTLKTKASAVPEKKETAAPDNKQLDSREEKVKQAERTQMKGRIATKFRSQIDPKMTKSLAGLYGGKIPPNVNKAEVMGRAVRHLAEAMGPAGSDKITQYLDAGDEAGAIKFVLSQASEQRIADAVEKSKNYLYGKTASAKKPDPKPDGQGGKGAGAGGGAGANKGQQFQTITFNPKATSIDLKKSAEVAQKMGLTRNQLFTQNKAVLRSGKLVTWASDAENEQ